MKKLVLCLIITAFVVGLAAEAVQAAVWTYHARRDGWLTVWGTINCQTIEPPAKERGYVYEDHYYAGTLPPGSNDYLTKFEWDASCGNIDWNKVAVPRYSVDKWVLEPLEDWLDNNMPSGGVVLPTMGDSTGIIQEIYVIVNLETWLLDPRPAQDVYAIVDGECPDLPGYLIGTTPIVFDSSAAQGENPFSTTPLTGELYHDGEIIFDDQPRKAPTLTEWGLAVLLTLLIASGLWVIYRRRRAAVQA